MGIGGGDDVDITPLEGTKVDGLGGGDSGLGAALDVLDMSGSHSQQGQEGQKTHGRGRRGRVKVRVEGWGEWTKKSEDD